MMIGFKGMGLEKHVRRFPPEQGLQHCGVSWCGVELFSWNAVPNIESACGLKDYEICAECKKAIKEAIGAW